MTTPKKKAPAKPTPLPTTRFDDALGEKLRWHFACEASNNGVRSSFAPLVAMVQTGPPPKGGMRGSADERMTDARSNRINAHRRIRSALAQLSPEHRDALNAAYGEERFTVETYHRFRDLGACAPVVLLSVGAKAAFGLAKKGTDAGLGEWLRNAAPTSVVAAAIAEATHLLDAARAAFVELHGDIKREAHAIRKAALRRVQVAVEPIEWRRRTSLAC
jgi:hypothetical protein